MNGKAKAIVLIKNNLEKKQEFQIFCIGVEPPEIICYSPQHDRLK